MTLSIYLHFKIGKIGPNISSCIKFDYSEGLAITVGSINYSFSYTLPPQIISPPWFSPIIAAILLVWNELIIFPKSWLSNGFYP